MPDEAAIVQGRRDTSYGAGCAVAWMLWDTAVHFDVEVECIWRRPTTWVKFAYAFVRYVPILNGGGVLALGADLTYPPSGCRGWIIDQLVVMELLTVMVEVILLLRVYAMYRRNVVVLVVVGIAFVAEIALMVATLVLVIPKQTFTSDCHVSSSPTIYIVYWLSSLCFETLLFALTLFKFYKHAKAERGVNAILFVFVRDGTWAFALIFAAMLLNTLMYQLVDTPLAGMGYFWALSVMSFSGSHILLNIRRLGTIAPDGTWLPSMQFTTVHPATATTGVGTSDQSDTDGAITFESDPPASDDIQLATLKPNPEVPASA